MKPKTLVLMVVAVGFGLVAAYLTSRIGAGSGTPEMVPVLVAKKDLPQGYPIKNPADDFEPKPFIKGTEPPKHVNDMEKLKGKVLSKSVAQGAHVTDDHLTGTSGPELKPGQRAYAIRVDQEKVAGGFVLPNSKVDVILTERDSEGKPHARTLLQSELVLAADNQLKQKEGEGSKVPLTVTLALTPEKVEILAEAKEKGTLSLALRSNDDVELVKVNRSGTEVKEPEKVEVWVAKDDIPAKTVLNENLLALKKYVKGQEPKKAIVKIDDLLGKMVKHQIAAEQFLTRSDLQTEEKPKPAAPVVKKDIKEHYMVIYNGGKEPEHWVYRTVNGKMRPARKYEPPKDDDDDADSKNKARDSQPQPETSASSGSEGKD